MNWYDRYTEDTQGMSGYEIRAWLEHNTLLKAELIMHLIEGYASQRRQLEDIKEWVKSCVALDSDTKESAR